jgi:hypothetical protein
MSWIFGAAILPTAKVFNQVSVLFLTVDIEFILPPKWMTILLTVVAYALVLLSARLLYEVVFKVRMLFSVGSPMKREKGQG